MKIAVMLTVSMLLFAGGLFWGVRGPAAQSETTIPCPRAVDAPFGGFDGWSQIEVQANFARALVARNGLLTCQYGFGKRRLTRALRRTPHPERGSRSVAAMMLCPGWCPVSLTPSTTLPVRT